MIPGFWVGYYPRLLFMCVGSFSVDNFLRLSLMLVIDPFKDLHNKDPLCRHDMRP